MTVYLSEQEICKLEIEFYMALGTEVEKLRQKMFSLEFPMQRLEKEEKFPIEVDLLNNQFKALSSNIWRVVGEKTNTAYPKERIKNGT